VAEQSYIAQLPADLQALAVSLRSFGVAEDAFPVSEAMPVLEALRVTGDVILGGDFWTRTADGYRPSHDNWYVVRRPSESDDQYRQRSIEEAARAIKAREPLDADQFVVLVVADGT
jgi:hypothetical protein